MPLTLFRLANWLSWPRSSASAKTLHGTSKSIPISMKAEGCGQYRTKCAKIFARAGLRTCRDWQNAPAFLEVLRKIAGTGAETHARKIRALEARPISRVAAF